MIGFIIINAICILLLIIYATFSMSLYGKSIFADMPNLAKLFVIIFPTITIIVNFIYLMILNKNLIFSLYPLIIPIIYFSYVFYDNHFSKKKFSNISILKQEISQLSKNSGINVSPEDVRIRLLPKNRVDIIVNTYVTNDYDALKEMLNYKKQSLNVDNRFPKITFNFYVDIKKKNNITIIAT
ncbi:hypothetical protein [Priestia flexa]|uniref:Uncharacterized protein n=1 Tax=Priestia flexa TaxID=86664 RepID=A0A8I1MC39_9BACI|nr:hypothetical protein [Priestia flexa]MBN8249988.1 hypothetical protein [Priestia flexa]